MTEAAIAERLDQLTLEVIKMCRLMGARLTNDEVCSRYKLHRNTLRNHVASGKLPTPMRDGKWSLADILEFEMQQPASKVRELEEQPKPPKPVDASDSTHHLYRYFDEQGALLYVGVSYNALNRMGGHRKSSPWFWRVKRLDVQHYASREDALIAEKIAIMTESPLFNIHHAKKEESANCKGSHEAANH